MGPDVMIVSFPKSGRTWVRVFLSRYRQHLLAAPEFDLAMHRCPGERGVTYEFSHAGADPKFGVLRWRKPLMRHSNARLLSGLPDWLYGVRPIRIPAGAGRYLFLVRDPRDVLVSFYHQARSRNRFWTGTVDAFARQRHIGIARIVALMNHLATQSERLHAPFFYYEELSADPERHFREFLSAAGDVMDRTALHEAVEFSTFNNMRRMEETGRHGKRLAAWRRQDLDSRKARRGQVGGYRRELPPATIAYIEDYLDAKLDRYFDRYLYET